MTKSERAVLKPSTADEKNGAVSAVQSENPENPVFEINISKEDIRAYAKEIEGEFVVLRGSQTRSQWRSSVAHNYQKHFERMFAEEKIKVDNEINKGVFQEDVPFSSPSAAAAMVYGRASNGRTEWKIIGTNKTYETWQNDLVKEIPFAPQDLALEDSDV